MKKVNDFDFTFSDYSKKLIAIILIILSIILYIFSVYNIKILTIPYYLDLGLIEVLPKTFLMAIILLVFVILFRIEKMGEFKYIILLLLLSIFIWGVRVFVESYAHAHDAWSMGYITKEVFEAGRFSIEDQNKPAMYYIGWPGSFVFLSFLVNITGFQIIDILKIYPLIISPILFFSVYILFRILSNNILLSRYAALFFLIVNSYVYIHWSPQSISLILFITLVLLMKQVEKSAHSYIIYSLILVTIFSIIIIHPTMSVILIIFLICIHIIILLSKYARNVSIDTHLSLDFVMILILITVALFAYWNLFVSKYTFSSLINETIPVLTNFFASEKTTSFAISRVTSPTIATKIRSSFFFISSLITISYLSYVFLKRKKIQLYETVFLMVAYVFAFIAFNLSKGEYSERVPMMAYFSISLIFGIIYVKLHEKKQLLKYTFISFLLITFTFYDHDILDLYSESIINGYNFSFSNSNGNPMAISADSYTIGLPFLILNESHFLNHVVFKNINISLPIQKYYMISDSNLIKWGFYNSGNINNYTIFQNRIDKNFLKVYENAAIAVYLNPKYEYKEGD